MARSMGWQVKSPQAAVRPKPRCGSEISLRSGALARAGTKGSTLQGHLTAYRRVKGTAPYFVSPANCAAPTCPKTWPRDWCCRPPTTATRPSRKTRPWRRLLTPTNATSQTLPEGTTPRTPRTPAARALGGPALPGGGAPRVVQATGGGGRRVHCLPA